MAEGKVVVVTGAASGIGRATALRLARDGWAVVAVDVAPALHDVALLHPAISACAADVSDAAGNAAMVGAALGEHGRLDGLVLNAGIAGAGRLDEVPVEQLDRMWAVNVRAVVLGLQAALPSLCASRGAVTVTASVSGLGGDPAMWAYNTTKGAVVNFVRAMAFDLGPQGVRVNAVCPGPIRATGMTAPLEAHHPDLYEAMRAHLPLQRWGTPEEVAAVHAFLLSDDASFVTGVALPVDGGVTCGTGQFRPGGFAPAPRA